MLLKHCKKFTAKITKQEIGALPTSSNGMSVLLIDSLDSTVLLLYVQNIYFQVILSIRKIATILYATSTTRFYI